MSGEDARGMPTAIFTAEGMATGRMIESAALAHAIADPDKLAVLLRALFQGVRLRRLAPEAEREETDALLQAIAAHADAELCAWREAQGAPVSEVEAAVARLEAVVEQLSDPVCGGLQPGDDGEAMALALCLAMTRADADFAEDVVARDIILALVRVAFAAARGYATALATLRFDLSHSPHA